MHKISTLRTKLCTRRSKDDEKRTAARDSVEPKKGALSCFPVFKLCTFEKPQPSINMSVFERRIEIDGRIGG